ncbi:MAG: D-tyrosyl-tRNA(Tyr) deacylase [Spirochaetes bacterium]|nr:D-tyrosyl-tRNA(Tyr) deacylase [Spirochaetota bacterium]MCK5268639.1 D-tyrosyl-tRNA(Tyr) deacylase [Spirochaetota bacterium]
MRAVVQRVRNSIILVGSKKIASMDKGLLILLGVGKNDDQTDADYLTDKIINLRIFESDKADIDASVLDIQGASCMVVSQFTLFGDCRKGRRPSFSNAASPDRALELYEYFIESLSKYGVSVKTGKFRAMMNVEMINYGPVTILLDSKREF